MASDIIEDQAKTNPKKVSSLLGITYEEDEILASRVEAGLVDLLVYGITGSAKTPLLASAKKVKELNNPIFIDIESGAHSAYKAGVEVIEFMTFHNSILKKKPKQSEETSLFDLFTKLKDLKKKTPESFNCLLIDGWTEIYMMIHAQCVFDGSGDKEVGTQNDRMRALVRIKKLSRLIRSIPVHIISTAREYTFTNAEGSSILERGPHLSGSTMKYVSAQSDIVARMRFVGNNLQFSVKEDSVTIARDRFYLLPDKLTMTEPSLESVWKYLRGDIGKGK